MQMNWFNRKNNNKAPSGARFSAARKAGFRTLAGRNFKALKITGGVLMLGFSVWALSAMIFPAARTSATESQAGSEIGINVRESIKLAVDKSALMLQDGDGNTQIAPAPEGTLITGDVNVAVTTTAYKGYTLSVYTADDTKAMKHNDTSVTAAISSIDTASGYDASAGVAELSGDTWGFRKYSSGTPSNWFAVGANSSSAAVIDTVSSPNSDYCDTLSYPLNDSGCDVNTYNTYQIGFGAKLTSALPAGTYTNNVVFSAVTNEASRYLTFNANAPAGATVSGSMAPKSIFSGATVTLPAGGFRRIGYGIKGWAFSEGATTVATVAGTALTPGATVAVDDLITAAGQSTSATTPVPLYAVWDNQYTLSYTANNPADTIVTGGMNPTETVLGLDVTIPANGFEVEGYNFLGFAFTSGATAVAQVAGEDLVSGGTFSTSDLITAAAAAGQSVSTASAGTIRLYGVWEIGTQYMQDFDCTTLESQKIVTLVDNRDNHEYKVKKLPDGKCWMIQNLTLSATDLITEGKALTSANTNIPSSDTNSYYVPPRNTRYATANSITNSAVATASASVNFDTSYSNHPQVAYKAKGDTSHSTGNALPEDTAWYPFYTATLGFSYYNDGKTSGSSPRDICPKGWRLPHTTDSGTNVTTVGSTNDFTNLARTYNSSASWSGSATGTSGYGYYTSDATIRKNMILGDSGSFDPILEDNGAAGFTYAGYYNSTTLYNVGTYGLYWSSSVYNSGSSYGLSFDTSYVSPQNYYNKYNGFAVRCVTGS